MENRIRTGAIQTGDLANTGVGRTKIYTIREGTGPNSTTFRVHVPFSALYNHRGPKLRLLNRNEYRVLVQVRPKKTTSKPHADEFDFSDNFILASGWTQVINAKLPTPVLVRPPPSYPGSPQERDSPLYNMWIRAADTYAQYFLVEYRPEENKYGQTTDFRYEYTWEALQSWIKELARDRSIISKFRLMSMHKRMVGLHVPFKIKKIVCSYRARSRDLWSPEEREKYSRQRIAERDQLLQNAFTDTEGGKPDRLNLPMSRQERENTRIRTESITATLRAFRAMFNTGPSSSSAPSMESPIPRKTPSNMLDAIRAHVAPESLAMSNEELVKQAKGLRKFKLKRRWEDGTPRPVGSHIHRVPPTQDQINAKIAEIERTLGRDQMEFFQVYCRYLRTLSPADAPPPIALLQGHPGTGKTFLVNAIIEAADVLGRKTYRTAFNHINCIALRGGGRTLAKSIFWRPEIQSKRFTPLTTNQLKQAHEWMDGTELIIIDEISNVTPWVLSQFSFVFQQVRNDFDNHFGGVPAILCGDLYQLNPVEGTSLCQAMLKYVIWKRYTSKGRRPPKLRQPGYD